MPSDVLINSFRNAPRELLTPVPPKVEVARDRNGTIVWIKAYTEDLLQPGEPLCPMPVLRAPMGRSKAPANKAGGAPSSNPMA